MKSGWTRITPIIPSLSDLKIILKSNSQSLIAKYYASCVILLT